ncbi:MAG: hypothetical protein H0U53_02230 [Actinobacteria bacterium]|nr:hypothetical protein [Actinomycetota bacterium]
MIVSCPVLVGVGVHLFKMRDFLIKADAPTLGADVRLATRWLDSRALAARASVLFIPRFARCVLLRADARRSTHTTITTPPMHLVHEAA